MQENHYPYCAARAGLLCRSGWLGDAVAAYSGALETAPKNAWKAFLHAPLEEMKAKARETYLTRSLECWLPSLLEMVRTYVERMIIHHPDLNPVSSAGPPEHDKGGKEQEHQHNDKGSDPSPGV